MLLASGLIVGEGLIGVVIAALVAFSGKDFPLQLVSDISLTVGNDCRVAWASRYS